MQLKRLLLVTLFIVSCAKSIPVVEPTKVPMEEIIEESATPQRTASMRFVQKGRDEINLQRYERAVAQLTRAIEIDASNPFAYFYLGFSRFQAGNFDQAKDLFRRSGDLFGTLTNWRAESYAYSGESFEKLSKIEQARKMYSK